MQSIISRNLLTTLALAALVVAALFGVVQGTSGTPDPNDAAAGGSPFSLAAASDVGQTETYTGVAPCRLLDTRTDKGGTGPLASGEARNFDVTGDLSGQGGEASGCDVPSNATSIAIVLTGIAQGDDAGYVRGWAAGSAAVEATLLNYSPALNASNQVNIPLCTGSCSDAFTLRNFSGTANIVGDVVGYYEAPMYASISDSGGIYQGVSSGVVSTTRTDTGSYEVVFDRPVTSCVVTTADIIFSTNRDVTATTQFGSTSATVEVRVRDESNNLEDTFFQIHVVC